MDCQSRKGKLLTLEHCPVSRMLTHSPLAQGLVEAWERWVRGQEFEDSPEWGQGPERQTSCIWISDDYDQTNIPARQPYFL